MAEFGETFGGLRVVTIEQAVAGPICTRHLADLGADVIKVESLQGEFARKYDATVFGESAHFVWLNFGKRSLALDFKTTDGRDVLRRLLERADVLVFNLAPFAMHRVIGDDELRALNPQLIRCGITGYGTSGPYAGRKAYDLLVQDEVGVTQSTGTSEQPAKCGVSIADLAGGVYAFAAINAAVHERMTTGFARRIDISLFDCLAEWMMPVLLTQRYVGRPPVPAGTRHATITPYGPYVASDGSIVNIAVQNEQQWKLLCRALDAEPLAEEARYSTNALRLANRDCLERDVASAVSKFTESELTARLERHGVPWGRSNCPERVLAHPQLAGRHRWSTVNLPAGQVAEVLLAPFLGDWLERPRRVPMVGEDTEAILRELGYGDADVRRLSRDNAIALPRH